MKLFLVIRTLVGSQWSCRRAVGENQSLGPLNPAGWNGHIARAQPRERRNFVHSGHEPQDAAGGGEGRVRPRHPAPPPVDSSQRDLFVGDVQKWNTGHHQSKGAFWRQTRSLAQGMGAAANGQDEAAPCSDRSSDLRGNDRGSLLRDCIGIGKYFNLHEISYPAILGLCQPPTGETLCSTSRGPQLL